MATNPNHPKQDLGYAVLPYLGVGWKSQREKKKDGTAWRTEYPAIAGKSSARVLGTSDSCHGCRTPRRDAHDTKGILRNTGRHILEGPMLASAGQCEAACRLHLPAPGAGNMEVFHTALRSIPDTEEVPTVPYSKSFDAALWTFHACNFSSIAENQSPKQ